MNGINFFEDFGLLEPIAGLVYRITSPKGIRRQEKDSYVYQLHKELCTNRKEERLELSSGVYQILDICKFNNSIMWNQYLFVVNKNGKAFPIAEYLNQTDSQWVKQAVPVLKGCFSSRRLSPIQLTVFEEPEETEDWSNCKK